MTNPNHTDTSRSGDLVERLRRTYPDYYNPARDSTGMAISPASLLLVRERLFNPDGLEAADLIETQAREIERLRDTPNRIWAEARDSEWDEGFNYAVKLFRAALARESHD